VLVALGEPVKEARLLGDLVRMKDSSRRQPFYRPYFLVTYLQAAVFALLAAERTNLVTWALLAAACRELQLDIFCFWHTLAATGVRPFRTAHTRLSQRSNKAGGE